jgi:hypothetical protein
LILCKPGKGEKSGFFFIVDEIYSENLIECQQLKIFLALAQCTALLKA